MDDIDKTFLKLKRIPFAEMQQLYYKFWGCYGTMVASDFLIKRDELFKNNGWSKNEYASHLRPEKPI